MLKGSAVQGAVRQHVMCPSLVDF